MPVANQQTVKRILAAREPVVTDIVLDAWDQWWNNPERPMLFRRTRATLVHNYMMNLSGSGFAGDRGVYLVQKQESLFFVADQLLVFRFKKGDVIGLSSNIETQAALAFNDPQQMLPELPDLDRVDIAYVLNPLETLVDRILVVARDSSRVVWSYSIYPRAAGAAQSPATLPIQPVPPASADTVVRLPAAKTEEKSDS
jgi:hypothetical protein